MSKISRNIISVFLAVILSITMSPYMGNQILKINDEGVIAEVLPIEMRIIDVDAYDFNDLNYESEISSLEGYINWVNNNKVDTKILKLKELDQFFSIK